MQTLAKPRARVRALVTDVDGVWTDGGMYFDASGQAVKRFNVKDGYIVGSMGDSGVLIMWVTGDDSDITRARASKLGIDEVCSGVEDKGQCVRALLERHDLRREQVVYMGDDLNDLSGMAEAGLTVCPSDAVAEVKQAADLVTTHAGGNGAVREICDLILMWNAEFEGQDHQ